jgi:hypothetical protein
MPLQALGYAGLLTTSFCAKTPSSFVIECGWGGREIDPPNCWPCELKDSPD